MLVLGGFGLPVLLRLLRKDGSYGQELGGLEDLPPPAPYKLINFNVRTKKGPDKHVDYGWYRFHSKPQVFRTWKPASACRTGTMTESGTSSP